MNHPTHQNDGECGANRASDERKPETWQARYEASETGWDRGEPGPALRRWLESGELSPCRILVPGCGNGHEVIELASRGFDVTAVDFADAPIANLNRQLAERRGKATVLQQDIFTFTAPEAFDAIYEQTCLCAIDPRDRERYENKLADSLRTGGKLYVLFMQSGKMESGPPFPCRIDDMSQLFDESRWDWSSEQTAVEHPAGLTEIAMVLTRR